ncbi:MAG: trypsin-like serine protease [Burkholderiales bacterium]|nr:trypsin-like serine protease [Burkholderiales bacterium]
MRSGGGGVWRRAASLAAALLASLALAATDALALLAGSANARPPDSPARRVDANVPGSPWAGVGSVSVRGGTYTGTLVSRTRVITAAHVVGHAPPEDIVFNLNLTGDLSHRIPARAVYRYPGYAGFDLRNPVHDLAVIELAEPAPEDAPVYPVYRGGLAPGTVIVLVGYGASGDGDHGANVPGHPAVKRVGLNRVDQFDAHPLTPQRPRLYRFDFDGPDASSNRVGGTTLGNTLETSVAGGDSGSPAFVRSRRGWLIAGVNTFQWSPPGTMPGRFGSGGGGVLLAPYADWIEAVAPGAPEAVWSLDAPALEPAAPSELHSQPSNGR